MIINIAYPLNGTQKKYEYKDEKMYAKLYDHKLGDEVSGDIFGEGFEGCLFRITGGSDKNGFGMKQGVATKNKKKLLLPPGSTGYRAKREGTWKRKSVRGCIVGPQISSLNLILVEKGEKDIADLTDVKNDRRLGPKRANKIRKLFNLPKHSDFIGKQEPSGFKVYNVDVQKAVVKRITKEIDGKKYYKAPRITRLLTTQRIRRKRVKRAKKIEKVKKNQEQLREYEKQLANMKKRKESMNK